MIKRLEKTMLADDLINVLKLANEENEENRRRALHNYDCKTSELRPYSNRAYLKMVGVMLNIFGEKGNV